MSFPSKPHIAIIGLGYVGLPLAIEFGKQLPCVGYDINSQRVNELEEGLDATHEVSKEELQQAVQTVFTDNKNKLKACNIYLITVPTPIDNSKQPDLTPLREASELVGSVLGPGNIVIYESTVYPGCTEEICIPILEQVSKMQLNVDFYAGYSPERINPGDKQRNLTDITKVTSGSTPEVATYIDQLYQRIIKAGTFKASQIKVAEASKVVENIQRDVNIALMNELAIIFKRLKINTEEVLDAASTKWNFLPFRPGLVGGHCIGVDPYYLVHKAELTGYHPEIISVSRRINDQIGSIVASEVMRLMTQKRLHIVDARILILGLAFKENCSDLRNTRVVDIARELTHCHALVDIHDPWVSPGSAKSQFGITLCPDLAEGTYDAVILAVAHDEYKAMGIDNIRKLCRQGGVIYDIKYLFNENEVDGRL